MNGTQWIVRVSVWAIVKHEIGIFVLLFFIISSSSIDFTKLNNRKWMKIKTNESANRRANASERRRVMTLFGLFQSTYLNLFYSLFFFYMFCLNLFFLPEPAMMCVRNWSASIKSLVINIVNKITDTLTQLTCVHVICQCSLMQIYFTWDFTSIDIYIKVTEIKSPGFGCWIVYTYMCVCFEIQNEN